MQSDENLNASQSCFPDSKLNSFAFQFNEVKKILSDLHSFGAVDLMVFFFFFS